jgi:FecR-like protein
MLTAPYATNWVCIMRVSGLQCVLTVGFILGGSAIALAADDGVWSVSKSSGEVWVATTGAEQVSLKQEETLKPGDTIRTGRNGRVLLVRGEETILVAPNSVIGLPAEKKDGLATTILQRAGSIVLEVEKKNVKHFEVETPYLAAVVKGTVFSVTVNRDRTSVSVLRGQVEVSDFKSGQIAQVMLGQVATTFAHGKPGLSLSGSGTLSPIEQGKPRASSIDRVPVPKGGLTAPQKPGDGKTIHALGPGGKLAGPLASASLPKAPSVGDAPAKRNVIRISSALGEVKLNINKATRGLAHGPGASGNARSASSKDSSSIWSDAKAGSANSVAQGNSNGSSNGNGSGAGTSTSGAAGTSAVAAVTAAASDTGLGNGATGNGNGNGNGNGGVGNLRGLGNLKH